MLVRYVNYRGDIKCQQQLMDTVIPVWSALGAAALMATDGVLVLDTALRAST